MKHRDREMVPRILVQAMFALMLAALALVAFARVTDRPLEGVVAESPIVQELTVTMVGDRSSGVALVDAEGDVLARSTDDKKGFIEVIRLSVMRARTLASADPSAPIRVIRHENGRVGIVDDASGWSITLIGYGVDNVAAFANLLET